MTQVPITKFNYFIFLGARVRLRETGIIGTVEDIYRKYNDSGEEVGVTVKVKLENKRYSQPYSPLQLTQL